MIILCDNQILTRMGVVALLPSKIEYCVAADRRFLATLLAAHPSSSVVLDYALFDFVSAEQLLIFLRRFPDVHWLLLSNEFGADVLRLFSSEQVVSFVEKEADETVLRSALTALLQGVRYVSPSVKSQVESRAERPVAELLTPTETAILKLIAQGHSSRDIAGQRSISLHTVVTHRKNIFRKLRVNTSYEATRYAVRAGLVNLVEYFI